jgi:hypothetical protein
VIAFYALLWLFGWMELMSGQDEPGPARWSGRPRARTIEP